MGVCLTSRSTRGELARSMGPFLSLCATSAASFGICVVLVHKQALKSDKIVMSEASRRAHRLLEVAMGVDQDFLGLDFSDQGKEWCPELAVLAISECERSLTDSLGEIAMEVSADTFGAVNCDIVPFRLQNLR